MLRREFEIPMVVLGDIMNFTFYQTDTFNEVNLTKKYDDMEITVHLEKSSKKGSLMSIYIGVIVNGSTPFTFRFEFMHLMDLFKVYCLDLKNDKLLLRITPQGGKLKPQEYIVFRPLIEKGMDVFDLSNFAYYISFNDKIDLCYLSYNLLLNNHFIIFEPSNVRTDLNLKTFLIDKFDHYGYDEYFLNENKHLQAKKLFETSEIALDTLIVYLLDVLLNDDKSKINTSLLKDLYNEVYNLM